MPSTSTTSDARRAGLARPVHIACIGVLALVGSLVLAGSTRAHLDVGSRAAAAAGSRLQVTEVEYRLQLSDGVVNAGPTSLEAIDGGRDAHDLRLQAVTSKQQVASPVLMPGHRWGDVVELKPGTYRLWCSLPEHARLGMHTTLRVLR
jgi:uncharacterized cupredoxin-like copper-binding protein